MKKILLTLAVAAGIFATAFAQAPEKIKKPLATGKGLCI